MRLSILPLSLLVTFLLLLTATANTFVLAAEGDIAVTNASPSSEAQLYTLDGTVRLPSTGRSASAIFTSGRILLNGGERTAMIRSDGSFQIFHLLPGRAYTIDVAIVDYTFPTVRVDISNKSGSKGRMTATLLSNKSKLPYPLVLRPVGKTDFFQKREPVNVFGMLKSPMVIMMGITLLMVVVMPRMMNNMDPQELEEMKKMQSKMSIDGWRKTLEAKAAEIQSK